MSNQNLQEEFTTLKNSINFIITTRLDESEKKLNPDYSNNFETYKQHILNAQKAFMEANEKSFKKAKDDKEKQAILENLTLIQQLLNNPTDDALIEKCYAHAESIDDHMSPFWIGLGIVLFISIPVSFVAFVLLVCPLVPAIPSVALVVSMIASAFVLFEIAAAISLCIWQSTPNKNSSSMTELTNVATQKVVDSHVTRFNIFYTEREESKNGSEPANESMDQQKNTSSL